MAYDDFPESLKGKYAEDPHNLGDPKLDVMLDIREQVATPIKAEPPGNGLGHWRMRAVGSDTGYWIDDPIQEDAPNDPNVYARGYGQWTQTISYDDWLQDKKEQDAEIVNRMEWKGVWSSQEYKANQVVNDAGWLMISNKVTFDHAAPQERGSPVMILPDAQLFTTGSFSGVVLSGMEIVLTEGLYIQKLQLQVPFLSDDTNYRYVSGYQEPSGEIVANVYSEPLLIEGGWATIAVAKKPFSAGTRVFAYIDALTSSDITIVTGGWNYIGDADDALAPGEWSRDKDNWVRIHRFDLDGTDRVSELMGVIPNSTLLFNETGNTSNFRKWRVNDNPNQIGDEIRFEDIVKDSDGGAGNNLPGAVLTTLTAEVPIPLDTQYSEAVDHWVSNQPAFGTVQGYLKLGANTAVYSNNAYGINIEVQPVDISEDWDFMAYSS